MRPTLRFLCVWFALAQLANGTASGATPFPVPAYHPTVCLVNYEGKWLPVYDSTGSGSPIVKIDGKEKNMPSDARLKFERANSFAPGFVDIRNNNTDPIPFGTGSYVRGVLKSDRSYTHCMAVMIAYNPRLNESVIPAETHVAIKGIADLKAGKEVKVLVNLPDILIPGAPAVLLLFSEGKEIQTSHSDAAGAFFRRLELGTHELVMRGYREKFQTADHAAQPYLRFPPVFPENVDQSTLPASVHLSLVIGRDGIAQDVTLTEQLPQDATLAILRAVGGWLFVPQLKTGYEQAVDKKIILQLRESAAPAPRQDKPADAKD
ncbi:MAG TPA: hypothetical protein VMC06_12135 [Opitutaceae bacterium]|nr:hypothetical protein [Opitutaceae bacterium]